MNQGQKFMKWRRTAELLRGRPNDFWNMLEALAKDKHFIADELERVQRATELEPEPFALFDFDAHVRNILEAE